jgi:glycolate oxidase iron-sulfur subunit
MQTRFSAEQLQNPDLREAEKILRACVHCGFCLATCPTYMLLGDELDSPRGRIYLIKDMLENDKPASPQVAEHVDRCLSCLGCMTTCPSGVNYMHLVDYARVRIEETHGRSWPDRLFRGLLAFVLPRPDIFRVALLLARIAKPLAPLFPKRLRKLIEFAPKAQGTALGNSPQVFKAEGKRVMRVALLPGCVQTVLAPEINAATIRLLNRHGVEVVIPEGSTCCGALVHHLGRHDEALASARANITAWTKLLDEGGLDAIVINAAGCGTMVKDYGFLLRGDPIFAGQAARISELACDVAEIVGKIGLGPPKPPQGLTVAYHSACSLQHGQKIHDLGIDLLTAAGFETLTVPDSHLCCGSAGTYNLLQPDLADELGKRKAAAIESVSPNVIATGNIGCMVQIGRHVRAPVVHTVELLDWATGGPIPPALRARGPQALIGLKVGPV